MSAAVVSSAAASVRPRIAAALRPAGRQTRWHQATQTVRRSYTSRITRRSPNMSSFKRSASAITASTSSDITRLGTDDARMSQIVIHGGTVYLSGQVADIATLESSDITAQTEQVLAKVDALLEQAGTSKAKLLSAQIWVKDMEEHFAPMNKVWCDWVDPDNKPVRACVASPMARPSILVEVMAIAAL